jgi:hypothetical protein
MQDLPDTLLSDAKDPSQRRYRLTFLVTSTDFSIARTLGGSAIGDRRMRENQAAIRDNCRKRHGEQNLRE